MTFQGKYEYDSRRFLLKNILNTFFMIDYLESTYL